MNLQELSAAASKRLDESFRAGKGTVDLREFITPCGGRVISIDAARQVIDEAMLRFDGARPASDAWVGPRLHSALRMSRREAARRGAWRFLGASAFPDYVRWRWGQSASAPLERFVGGYDKHALARLWWMSEMFRNGADYGPAIRALGNQDIVNNFFRMDVAHHRPTALAFVRVIDGYEGDRGRAANALARAVNSAATTLLVDAVGLDRPIDDEALRRWIEGAESFDPLLYLEQNPPGPDEEDVSEASIDAAQQLLVELMAEAKVRGRRSPSGAESVVTVGR
jgi:hypothetical protein